MRWQVLTWMASCVVIATGCGKKADCKQLCELEAQCVAEIAVELGTATPEQTSRLTEQDRKALGERQRVRCTSNCTSPTKPSSVHTKWRGCMENKDCGAFAKCVYRSR